MSTSVDELFLKPMKNATHKMSGSHFKERAVLEKVIQANGIRSHSEVASGPPALILCLVQVLWRMQDQSHSIGIGIRATVPLSGANSRYK